MNNQNDQPTGNEPFDALYRLMLDIPSERQRIEKFFQMLSEGFMAVADATTRASEQQQASEAAASMGLMALQDEVAALRRTNNAQEGHRRALMGVIKRMVIELTTESPIPGTDIVYKDPNKRINDARAIGQAALQ